MNFITFPVGSTNIFPIANSKLGGQLTTEWNLRSRESVGTDPAVEYFIGPSYTHGEEDFKITKQLDSLNNAISSTAIQIAPGRAVVNGHFIESLAPIVIDLADANITLKQQHQVVLTGQLCVGLRVMYSTAATMAGSMLGESDAALYQGIQVVILPKDGQLGDRFTLPSDSPTEQEKVNAHLKLGEVEYVNGTIVNIIQDDNKYKNIDAARIQNIDALVSDEYVKKSGLNAKKIYTFSGKGTDPLTNLDTWCDSTDSLIVWDATPDLKTGTNPGVSSAKFQYNWQTGCTELVLPHKQPDGMTDATGSPQYYADKLITLPVANYSSGSGGTVDTYYTENIRTIAARIDTWYELPQGHMKLLYAGQYPASPHKYEPETSDSDLPPINSNWNPGDYILVEIDTTATTSTNVRQPSTMYVVLPAIVTGVQYVASGVQPNLIGTQLSVIHLSGQTYTDANPVPDNDITELIQGFRGTVDQDYFKVVYTNTSTDPSIDYVFWYKVATTDGYKVYSNPIWVTGEVAFATDTNVGGFLNIPTDTISEYERQGYVYLDSNGHLRVMDYELLSQGISQVQFGQNLTIASTLSASGIQEQLDEYVNGRIAFPNKYQMIYADDPYILDIYFTLTVESEAQTIELRNLDTRFDTVVRIHIMGQANSNTTIKFTRCEKIKLDCHYSGNPILELDTCCLWYDASVLQSFNTISNLSLWYRQFSSADPNILVDGMTVQLVSKPEFTEAVEYWSQDEPNDNHYSYALRSLTFGSDGTVIGCSLFVTDDITANIATGTYISIFSFSLPQSIGLPYPANRVSRQLKVTGSFITAYPVSTTTPMGYIVKNNSFTALTDAYTSSDTSGEVTGMISFQTIVANVTNTGSFDSTKSIDSWESGKFHIFYGGTVE